MKQIHMRNLRVIREALEAVAAGERSVDEAFRLVALAVLDERDRRIYRHMERRGSATIPYLMHHFAMKDHELRQSLKHLVALGLVVGPSGTSYPYVYRLKGVSDGS